MQPHYIHRSDDDTIVGFEHPSVQVQLQLVMVARTVV
jgi:hypothetical protein